MRNIWVVAKNTFKLEVREKILYAIIVFAVLYMLSSLFLADLVLKELPMVKSFALAGTYFFNAILALFLGTTSFFKDVDRKVVYFVLSKPVTRAQFLLGKFLGLCLVLLATTAIFMVAYLGVIGYEGGGFDVMGIVAIALQYVEMVLFIAFATFVSTFSTSLLSIVYTSAVFFAGHIVSALVADAQAIHITGLKYRLVQALYYIFPNLEKFDIRDFAVHAIALPASTFVLAVAYAAVYATLLLVAGIWIFNHKEI
ncbi:MAG TPA: ABC transporter permease subunit [Candidatus Paceibacterota bacterium]|nr:ABC transporter permease subunit [Candidatus Paceibacterota bacterium]